MYIYIHKNDKYICVYEYDIFFKKKNIYIYIYIQIK